MRTKIFVRRKMDVLAEKRYKLYQEMPFRTREIGYDNHGFSHSSFLRISKLAREYFDHVDIW